MRFGYRLSWLRITLTNLLRRPMQNYYCGGGPEVFRETLLHVPFNMFPVLRPLIRPLRPIWRPLLTTVEGVLAGIRWGQMHLYWAILRLRGRTPHRR